MVTLFKKIHQLFIFSLVSLFGLVASSQISFAQAPDPPTTGGGGAAPVPINKDSQVELINPLQMETIEGLLRAIIAVVLVFAVPIIIFFIIYAGFLYVTARGNEQQVRQATTALLYAVVGGLLILGAYVLIDIIANLITAIAD